VLDTIGKPGYLTRNACLWRGDYILFQPS
jgi:hypothetical protein